MANSAKLSRAMTKGAFDNAFLNLPRQPGSGAHADGAAVFAFNLASAADRCQPYFRRSAALVAGGVAASTRAEESA
jgi:hypothetical protein